LVSASIQDLPLESALEMVLAPNNYSFKRISNFFLVGESSPDNPSFYLLSDTCIYKPVHLKPQEIVALMPEHTKRFITHHPERGLLMVVAPARITASII
ncbi:MAG: STN domain-containing protein, partial [Chloroflexi bacterium]|nr:STN domain-containing protein [Chloroflexota bacterium]